MLLNEAIMHWDWTVLIELSHLRVHVWIQLLAQQPGVRVTDVPDAEVALQATRKADGHLEVSHLLHTAQEQHPLSHILGENTPQNFTSPTKTIKSTKSNQWLKRL